MSGTRGNPFESFVNHAANAYGANATVLGNIARLESSWDPQAWNNDDSNAAAGINSRGMFQFIPGTFSAFSRQAKAANPNAWKGMGAFDIMNWRQQALTTAWAIKNGKGSHWSTYDRALRSGGNPFGGVAGTGASNDVSVQMPGSGHYVGAGPDQKRIARIQNYWGDDPTLAAFKTKNYIDANQQKWVETPGQTVTIPGGGAGGGFMGAVGGNYQNRFRTLGNKFGLQWDSDAPWGQNAQQGGGQHTDGSNHYSGRATDWGTARNSLAQLMQLARWARKHRSSVSEMYFNHLGWGIRDGKVIKGLTEPGHDDHLHLALR